MSFEIALTWSDNGSTAETGFKIEQSKDGTTFVEIGSVGANRLNWNATGLTPSTKYYFRVRATNAAGASPYSNVASATTEAVPSPTPTPTVTPTPKPTPPPGVSVPSPTPIQTARTVTLSWTDAPNAKSHTLEWGGDTADAITTTSDSIVHGWLLRNDVTATSPAKLSLPNEKCYVVVFGVMDDGAKTGASNLLIVPAAP